MERQLFTIKMVLRLKKTIGIWECKLENGIQSTEGNFKNNAQHKTWIFRMPDNKTVTVVKFDKGKELSVKDVNWKKKDLPLTLGDK